jgi:hypothetical protein
MKLLESPLINKIFRYLLKEGHGKKERKLRYITLATRKAHDHPKTLLIHCAFVLKTARFASFLTELTRQR